jgi:hypothetical protein
MASLPLPAFLRARRDIFSFFEDSLTETGNFSRNCGPELHRQIMGEANARDNVITFFK